MTSIFNEDEPNTFIIAKFLKKKTIFVIENSQKKNTYCTVNTVLVVGGIRFC